MATQEILEEGDVVVKQGEVLAAKPSHQQSQLARQRRGAALMSSSAALFERCDVAVQVR